MWRLALLAVSLVGLAAPTLAQPRVTVRAETRIELDIERRPEGVVISATLRDDRGDPLADRTIEVQVAAADGVTQDRVLEATDSIGQLRSTFQLEPGTYRVAARFGGEEHYRGVEVAQNLDLIRAHVRLGMSVEGGGRLDRLDLDVPVHHFLVRADSPAGGAGLAITLENEARQPLGDGSTGPDGSVRLSVTSADLGQPSAGRLIVRTEGDETRALAQTEVLVVRYRNTALVLTTPNAAIDDHDEIVLGGQLSDTAGPLPRRAVGLFVDGEHLATVLTDDEGRFERRSAIGLSDESDNHPDVDVVIVHARFTSDAPWRPSARSEPISVTVRTPAGTPWPWILATMFICAVIVVVVSRRRPKSVGLGVVERPRISNVPGIVAAKTKARQPSRVDVAGSVVDADDAEAIANAVISLSAGSDRRALHADRKGRFRVDELPHGTYRMSVEAPGYDPRKAELTIPHRGQWSRTEVRLSSLRQIALRHYRPVAEALVPERRWWAFWTARELGERAHPRYRSEVEELTEAVEQAAYGMDGPSAPDVDEIGRRATAVTRSLKSDEGG